MLRGIHKASSTWLGKVVLGSVMLILVFSFAIWGIGDIFRGGFGRNDVAKIGGSEITIERFRQYYNEQLQQAGRQIGRPITPDQARALQLDKQFLGRLIAEVTLSEKARELRLGVSDAEITNRIVSDPAFRGPTGQFDQARFLALINQAGFTEGRFIAEQRQVMLRRQIAQSISGEMRVPTTALEVVNNYRNEKRAIDYIAFGPAQAGDIPAPTPEQLAAYFDARKALFRAPEYRKITLLTLSPAELAKPDAVSDADAKANYEQRKAQFGKPEKREVRQILFPTPEEAAAAREKIAKGASFDDVAKERGVNLSDTNLGLLTKADINAPAMAEAAFALKPGDVSQPVKNLFGTVLLTVGKIEPGEQKTYEEVAPQIKREIAESRARIQLGELRDKVEDEKASGATLAETAKKLGLKATIIEAVDRSGRGPDGKPIDALPKAPDVAAAAFGSDVGVDNEALQLPAGGYLYFETNGITPSREHTLEEVKDKVEAAWRDDEIAKRLAAKTTDLLLKLKNGNTLEQVAAEAGLTVQKGADLQRGKPGGFVPGKLVQAAFVSAKDAPSIAEGDKATERFIFKVTAVEDPKLDANSPEAKAIAATLLNGYADDVVGSYIARLENEYNVTINQAALSQVVGGTEPGS